MKTKEQIIEEVIDVSMTPKRDINILCDPDDIKECMERFSDQEKQALKEKLIKKIEVSKLSGLSKATMYALITQL